jgi:hypothetical protein
MTWKGKLKIEQTNLMKQSESVIKKNDREKKETE